MILEWLIDKIITEMKKSGSLLDNEEIIRYGLEIMISKACFAVIITIIGILLQCLLESIVFTLLFSAIRQYGGGYHAETRKKCFILSLLTLISAMGFVKLSVFFPVMAISLSIMSVFSAMYILICAPIDTENNRLDKDEIRVYGNKARIITALLLIVEIILWVLKIKNLSATVMTGILIEAFLMLKGYFQNTRKNGESI